MVRSLGRTLFAAALVAAGCRDMNMDLFPPPPPAGAGTGAESGTGDDQPPDDGGSGGRGGSGTGGTGGIGGSGGTGASGGFPGGGCGGGSSCPCQPGTPGCISPCYRHADCPAQLGLPFCAYGHCVECLSDCEPGTCGCAVEETCAEVLNYCVPRCGLDLACDTKERPYCVHDACSECTSDSHCEGHSRRLHCNIFIGACVECVTPDDCKDEDAPVCSFEGTCQPCRGDADCADGRVCRDGRCLDRSPPQQQTPPEP